MIEHDDELIAFNIAKTNFRIKAEPKKSQLFSEVLPDGQLTIELVCCHTKFQSFIQSKRCFQSDFHMEVA